MEWYSRSEKKCSAISLLTELGKISIVSAVRTVSPKLHKLNLHHLHNSCHVFTGIISTTAKVFTKQLSSKPSLKFIKATFSLHWGVSHWPSTVQHDATPHFCLFDFFQPFLRSERKIKGKGFHNILTKFLRSPSVEVLYLLQKPNYKATTPLSLTWKPLIKGCH